MTPHCNHLYYFSPTAIRTLLTNAGFRVVQMVPEEASPARHSLFRLANRRQFVTARLVCATTSGNISFAAKELYLSMKSRTS